MRDTARTTTTTTAAVAVTRRVLLVGAFAALLALVQCAGCARRTAHAAPATTTQADFDYSLIGRECSLEPCGSHAYDPEACKFRGCCWSDTYEVCMSYKPEEKCAIPAKGRSMCGWAGITPAECVGVEKCCWSPLPPDNYGPWCYYDKNTTPPEPVKLPHPNCDVGRFKTPCYGGWDAMTIYDCMSVGCCWNENATDYGYKKDIKEPKCFQPLMTCDIDFKRRYDCGYPGVDRVACLKADCCFDPLFVPPSTSEHKLIEEVPWCYYREPVIVYPKGWNASTAADLFGLNKEHFKKYYPDAKKPHKARRSGDGIEDEDEGGSGGGGGGGGDAPPAPETLGAPTEVPAEEPIDEPTDVPLVGPTDPSDIGTSSGAAPSSSS